MEVSLDRIYTLTPSDLSGPPSYNIRAEIFIATPEESVLALSMNTMPLGAKGEVWACAEPCGHYQACDKDKNRLANRY